MKMINYRQIQTLQVNMRCDLEPNVLMESPVCHPVIRLHSFDFVLIILKAFNKNTFY